MIRIAQLRNDLGTPRQTNLITPTFISRARHHAYPYLNKKGTLVSKINFAFASLLNFHAYNVIRNAILTQAAFKCLPLHLGSGQSVVKHVCVRIVVSLEIRTIQNLDLEGKKLFNIYLHGYGSFVRQADDTYNLKLSSVKKVKNN